MRILAPLLVLVVLGTVAVRWITDSGADRDRAWIQGSWDLAVERPDVKERFARRLDGLLEAHGDDPEVRWFAARAWLKVGEVDRALDAVWTDPAAAEAPGAARRFGHLLLRHLGFLGDERLEQPRMGAAQACIVLAEGGDEEAAAWLDETIRTRLERGFLEVLYGTFLYSAREGRLRVAASLRARGEPGTDVLAALACLGPDPYPERDADLAQLEEVVLRDSDRSYQGIIWATSCMALGRSEDARALDVLAGLHRRLAASASEAIREDAAIVAAGLLGGGRWSMLETLSPYLGERGLTSKVRVWYAEALQNRLHRGDPEAPDAWMALWDAIQRHPDPLLGARVATALLLRDAPPPPHLPVDRVLADLEAGRSPPVLRAIASSWRFRQGEKAGREGLLATFRGLAANGWQGDSVVVPSAMLISPVLTACRGLYLYDPTVRP